MKVTTMDCLHVVRQLWDYLDRETTPDADASIRHHLATCTGCTEHVEFCRSFLQTLRAAPISQADLAVARDRIRAAISREG
ncbi:MAG: zf-HC2 domain-containing protein [Longimicrobiales bacterium]